MTESSAVIVFVTGLLKAATAVTSLVSTRIFEGMAPQDTTGDYILLIQNSYHEIGTAIDGSLGAARVHLTVKAVTRGSGYDRAEAIVKAAHDALQGQTTPNVEGCKIERCTRRRMIRYLETPSGTGVTYAHLGSMYDIIVSAV